MFFTKLKNIFIFEQEQKKVIQITIFYKTKVPRMTRNKLKQFFET